MLSCLTKLEKLLCLKYLGRRLMEKVLGSHTMKLLLALLQDTTSSVLGSSTISYVLVRKGGGPASCMPSIGWGGTMGASLEWDEELAPGFSSFTEPRGYMAELQIVLKSIKVAVFLLILDGFFSIFFLLIVVIKWCKLGFRWNSKNREKIVVLG